MYVIDNGYELELYTSSFRENDDYSLVHGTSYYSQNSTASTANGYLAFNLDYEIKAEKFLLMSRKEIIIRIPTASSLLSMSLTLNGAVCTDCEQDGQLITIPVTEPSGKIRFTIIPEAGNPVNTYAAIKYYASGAYHTDVINIINSETAALTVETAGLISSKSFNVKGAAVPETDVSLYLDNVLQKTVKANKAGRYSCDLAIASPVTETEYTVKAQTQYNSKTTYVETKVKYRDGAPSLNSFVMYYNGNAYDMMNSAKHNITFSNSNYSFLVSFINPQTIDKVYVTSERNNTLRKIEAVWSETRNCFVASGSFEPGNSGYVPGSLNVYYTLKNEDLNIKEYVETFIGDSKDDMPEMWKNCEVDIIKQTDKEFEATITFSDGNKILYTSNVYTIDEAYTEILGEAPPTKKSSRGGTPGEEYIFKAYEKLVNYIWAAESDYIVAGMTSNDEELSTIVIDTIDGEVKKDVIKHIGTEVLEGGLVAYGLGEKAAEQAASTTFSLGYGVVKTGISWYNKEVDIDAARMEAYSLSGDERTAALSKVNELKEKNAEIAVMSLVGTALKTSGKLTIAANPVVGCILYGTGIIVNDIIVGFMNKEFENSIACLKGNATASVTWAIDPSGYVYEAVESNRLQGVTATAYYKADESSTAQVWDASEWSQVNPLITDTNGCYAWDVPEGFWQVKYEKEGYTTTYSEWLPVPPPQTQVNIGMVSVAAPEIVFANNYVTYVELGFDKYMDVSSVTKDNLVLKDKAGANTEFSVTAVDSHESPDGKTLAKVFKLIPVVSDNMAPCTLDVKTAVKSYADIALAATYSKQLPAHTLFTDVTIGGTLAGKIGTKIDTIVQLQPSGNASDLILKCTSVQPELADAVSVGKFDDTGKAIVTIDCKIAGEVDVLFEIEGTTLKNTASIVVVPEVKELPVKHVTGVSLSSNTAELKKGETLQLGCSLVPFDAKDTSVSWSSNNEAVATVSQSGLGTAVAAGSAVVTVTTTDGGYTSACTVSVTSPVHNHTFGTYTRTLAPTCTTPGSEKAVCSGCGEEDVRTVNALGHNYSSTWTTDKAATCKEAGSKSHQCTRCDAKRDITAIDKTAHTPGAAATCTTAQKCTVCNELLVSALRHDYSAEWTVDKAATATEEGSKSHHCTRCDAKTDITVIPKLITKLSLKTGTEFTTDDAGYMLGQVKAITAADIKSKIANSSASITVTDKNSKALADNAPVGTGAKINLVDDTGKIVDTLTVVISGDANGDGAVTTDDARDILRAAVGIADLSGAYAKAAKVTTEKAEITTDDARKILRRAVGLE